MRYQKSMLTQLLSLALFITSLLVSKHIFHTETVFLKVSEAIERSIKRKVKYNLKQISIYKLLSSKDRDARIPP